MVKTYIKHKKLNFNTSISNKIIIKKMTVSIYIITLFFNSYNLSI